MSNKLGETYQLSDEPEVPDGAKYLVIYWGTVTFFKYKREAESFKSGLPYYQQEDAHVGKAPKKEKPNVRKKSGSTSRNCVGGAKP